MRTRTRDGLTDVTNRRAFVRFCLNVVGPSGEFTRVGVQTRPSGRDQGERERDV